MGLSERDRELIDYLNEPAPVGGDAGVTRFLFEIYERRTDVQEVLPDLERDGAAFIEWVHAHGRYEVEIMDELLPPEPSEYTRFRPPAEPPIREEPKAHRDWGVNVFGFHRAEAGIGEAGRLAIAGLDACDVPLLPVEGRLRPIHRHDQIFDTVPAAAAGFPINLICTNPPGLLSLVSETGPDFVADKFSIGYFWWETDGPLPFDWRPPLSLLDEVWVASRYVADCLSPDLPTPVSVMTLPVTVDAPPKIPPARLGLLEGFRFLFIFDYGSTLRRKNPLGVIEAFTQAFSPDHGASLTIKCVNSSLDPEGHEGLQRAAAEHSDIRIIDRYISAAEKNAMIAACDCYVSLHRAEGLGLTAAEAMYLGKPVIATGYSGNLEFMTEENSHLVRYEMTTVGDGAWPYPRNGRWCEPDLGHAAALMRKVYEDPVAARELGAKAARDIRRTHSPKVAGESMARRLEAIAATLSKRQQVAPRASKAVDDYVGRGPLPRTWPALGPLAGPLQRLLSRALEPYTTYQRQVNRHLLEALRQAEAAAEHATGGELVAGLELRIAQARAAELRLSREGRLRPLHVPPEANSAERTPVPAETRSADSERARHLRGLVDSVPFWWHSIDLGDGVVTPGHKGNMEPELHSLRLPELGGKDVLDIGAWDGFYSFEAERRGARSVVALDHFVWSTDMTFARGGLINPEIPDVTETAAWKPDELPGKRGFDIAHEALASRVESVVEDFMTIDLERLGRFDVVFYLGVLYHMKNPLSALERVAAVTREVAVIESEAVWYRDQQGTAICEFFAVDQLGGDHTNWWAPNLAAIQDLAFAAGFRRVDVVKSLPDESAVGPGPVRYRAVVHAFK